MLVPRALNVSVPCALGVVVSMQLRNSVPFQTVALGLSAKTSVGRPALRATVYRNEAGFR